MWSRTQGVESERSALAAANANFYRSAEAKLWARGLVAVASWAALPVGSLRVSFCFCWAGSCTSDALFNHFYRLSALYGDALMQMLAGVRVDRYEMNCSDGWELDSQIITQCFDLAVLVGVQIEASIY